MKSKAAILWFVVSLVLGVALLAQRNQVRNQRLKLEKLQLQVEKTASSQSSGPQVKELEKERLKLMGELRAAEFELNTLRMSAAATQATNLSVASNQAKAGASEKPGANGMAKMLGNMLKDPEMRKAMEQQQRLGLDMVYGSLFKELQLTPEQEKKFKDMMLAQQMENISQASTMFDTQADKTAVARELAEKRKQNEEQLKELLGDEKFARYQDYNQTLGERMMLDQLARSTDISREQNEQLLTIMREEKRNVQINLGNAPNDSTQDFQAVLGSEDATQRLFNQQEEINQRVLERAGQVLGPEQMSKFGAALSNQTVLQKAGLKMARQMFGNDSKAQAPPTPVQQTE